MIWIHIIYDNIYQLCLWKSYHILLESIFVCVSSLSHGKESSDPYVVWLCSQISARCPSKPASAVPDLNVSILATNWDSTICCLDHRNGCQPWTKFDMFKIVAQIKWLTVYSNFAELSVSSTYMSVYLPYYFIYVIAMWLWHYITQDLLRITFSSKSSSAKC